MPDLVIVESPGNQPRAWLNSHERYAFPRIGSVAVSEVNSADVLEILSLLWHTKMVTAQKMRGRIGAVLEWAIAMNYRADNPCDRIAVVLGRQQHVVEHMPALPHREVAAALAAGSVLAEIARRQPRVRVSGAHRRALGRGSRRRLGGDRPGRPRVDCPRRGA